jgi:hypothetical protein
MAHSACKRRWKNKANSRRAGWLRGPSNMQNEAKLGQDGICGRRRVREGQWRKTNPIPAGPDTPPFHYSIIPAFQPDANRAKQTQFGPGRIAGGADCAKQTQFGGSGRGGFGETKPIAGGWADGRCPASAGTRQAHRALGVAGIAVASLSLWGDNPAGADGPETAGLSSGGRPRKRGTPNHGSRTWKRESRQSCLTGAGS